MMYYEIGQFLSQKVNAGEYGDGFNVGVKFGSKYGSMSYSRAIYKADYEYRKIPSEIYADKMAIKIMKKHRVALRNIIKKNVGDFKYIDMTDEYNKKRYCDNFYRYFVRY